MKHLFCLIIVLFSISAGFARPVKPGDLPFFKADNKHIKYTGRIDFSVPYRPRFWSPGVYIQAKFRGSYLKIFLKDEQLWGKTQNYLEIAIDNETPYRIQTKGQFNKIKVPGLSNAVHTVTICKDTESGIGYIEFWGLKCEELLPAANKPKRKIEYIGDSITAGTGSDQSVVKCDQGQWYDQHNAYMSYGPITSRALQAQWHISAVAGIGLIHSCCNMGVTMPQVFDKLNLRSDSLRWDFSKYTPDVVTICLGQNDGKQDSVTFCTAYVNFINMVRSHYKKADIICLTSPMGNAELTSMLKKYIMGVEQFVHDNGDKKVSHYFFSRSFNDGCGGHPSIQQHQLIADELTGYIKQLKHW